MAIFGVWKNGSFTIGGVDLSDHVREMSIEKSLEEAEPPRIWLARTICAQSGALRGVARLAWTRAV